MEMMSPHPAARSLAGAWDIILLSATIASGDCALMDVVSPLIVKDAWEEQMPSCEAAVGTERKGTQTPSDASLAMSIDLPPPAPIRKPASLSRARALCAIYLFQLGGTANDGLGLVAAFLQELRYGLSYHILGTRAQ